MSAFDHETRMRVSEKQVPAMYISPVSDDQSPVQGDHLSKDSQKAPGSKSGSSSQDAWYYRPVWILVLAFLVLGPFALFLIWKAPRMTGTVKWVLAIVITLYSLYCFYLIYRVFVFEIHTINEFNRVMRQMK